MKTIERYSTGTGDRFGRQGATQITAFRKAREKGVDVAIVWNKSNREHVLIGTEPADQRAAYGRFDEVVAPYAEVIDIDRKKLPSAACSPTSVSIPG